MKQKCLSVGDWAGSKLRTMSKAPKPEGLFRGAFTLQAQFPCLRWPNNVISKQHIKSDLFQKDFGAFTCGLKWDLRWNIRTSVWHIDTYPPYDSIIMCGLMQCKNTTLSSVENQKGDSLKKKILKKLKTNN